MAQLIKVGDRIINLDNVTEIDLEWQLAKEPTSVMIYFNTGAGEYYDRASASFAGADAEALRKYLSNPHVVVDIHQLHTEVRMIGCIDPLTDAVEGRR